MNKLKQIEALVEEAFIKLGIVTRNTNEKKILIDFGRKCAEIDEEDWEDSSRTWIGDTIKTYNSRLLGDEKKEVKQEQPALQPLPEEIPKLLLNDLDPYRFWDESENCFNYHFSDIKKLYNLFRKHFGTPSNNLQPLPEQMPEWFASYFNGRGNDAVSCYIHCKYTFGTQPREWWKDLKKGDKFMYLKNTYELDAILLRSEEDYSFYIEDCSPYTDPEAQLRKTLNPEQIKLLDEMKANTKANTKV